MLARTEVRRGSRIGELSKGMITQLHLALIMAIDARLLVLDDVLIGLDMGNRRKVINRKRAPNPMVPNPNWTR